MNKITVTHVANYDLGLKIHLGNYMCYQRDQGYCVSAVTHPGRWIREDTTILDGIFVKVIPFEPRLTFFADFTSLLRLIAYIRQEHFDIVHTHTVKPGLLGRIAAKLSGVPVIIHTVHGFFFYDGMTPTQANLFVAVEKLGSACGDMILSQNRNDIETAIQKKICSDKNILYLGNGIDLNRFNPDSISSEKALAIKENLEIESKQVVIGYVARLEREKGIYEFLDAANKLLTKGVNARFLVIGTYQPKKQSSVSPEILIQKYNIHKAIHLLGHRDDIPELLSLMDIVVLPTHGREGIPRILMESAAMGKPVVATRVRGVTEVVDDGITGLLVPEQDSQAITEAVHSLIQHSEIAAEMGANGRQKALSCFDERFFFYRTDAVYRDLLKTKQNIEIDSILKPLPIIN